jgi:transposase
LLFLPPYSPQLAPIERVWKLTRRLAMHNHYFATLVEVLKGRRGLFPTLDQAKRDSAKIII